MSGDHSSGPRGFSTPGVRVPKLPHIVTALISIVLTLGLGSFSNIFQGPAGAAGVTKVITKPATGYGVCAYFGPDASGRLRFQLTSPVQDAAGSWCQKGKLVSVVPGRP